MDFLNPQIFTEGYSTLERYQWIRQKRAPHSRGWHYRRSLSNLLQKSKHLERWRRAFKRYHRTKKFPSGCSEVLKTPCFLSDYMLWSNKIARMQTSSVDGRPTCQWQEELSLVFHLHLFTPGHGLCDLTFTQDGLFHLGSVPEAARLWLKSKALDVMRR